MPGSAAISAANAGLEGFVRAAALELPRGLRINAVAPGWLRETLVAMKMDPDLGMPAAEVAQTYLRAVEGSATGQILDTVPRPEPSSSAKPKQRADSVRDQSESLPVRD
jgi:NAD(P)-dependent dehydrogenase (short-subunit alcohol dehydrogenase family)